MLQIWCMMIYVYKISKDCKEESINLTGGLIIK